MTANGIVVDTLYVLKDGKRPTMGFWRHKKNTHDTRCKPHINVDGTVCHGGKPAVWVFTKHGHTIRVLIDRKNDHVSYENFGVFGNKCVIRKKRRLGGPVTTMIYKPEYQFASKAEYEAEFKRTGILTWECPATGETDMAQTAATIIDIITKELAQNKSVTVTEKNDSVFVTSGRDYHGLTKEDYYKGKGNLTADDVADWLGTGINAKSVERLRWERKETRYHRALYLPCAEANAKEFYYPYPELVKWRRRCTAAKLRGDSTGQTPEVSKLLDDMLAIDEGLMVPTTRKNGK